MSIVHYADAFDYADDMALISPTNYGLKIC